MDIKDFNPTELDYTTGEPDYKFKGKKGQKVENLGCRT